MVLVIPLRAGYFLRFGDLDPVMSVDLDSQALCPVMTEDFFDDHLSFYGMLEIESVFELNRCVDVVVLPSPVRM